MVGRGLIASWRTAVWTCSASDRPSASCRLDPMRETTAHPQRYMARPEEWYCRPTTPSSDQLRNSEKYEDAAAAEPGCPWCRAWQRECSSWPHQNVDSFGKSNCGPSALLPTAIAISFRRCISRRSASLTRGSVLSRRQNFLGSRTGRTRHPGTLAAPIIPLRGMRFCLPPKPGGHDHDHDVRQRKS